MFLNEKLTNSDVFGIIFAIIGTGTIVAVSASTEEVVLRPEDIVDLLYQQAFIIYFLATVAVLIILLRLSQSSASERYILIDLLLVAIFGMFSLNVGGYTVLSTKAISSLINLTFFKMFTYPITYVMILVLASTAILQITFLNKSLSKHSLVKVIRLFISNLSC